MRMLILIVALLIAQTVFLTAEADDAEMIPGMQWTSADMLSPISDISIFRYSSNGLGAYPWRMSVPGAPMRVCVDGVPLYGYSPFGPDLDLVPAAFVDSVFVDSQGRLSIVTGSGARDEPMTKTNFISGDDRLFHFDAAFRRKVGENGSFFLGGASNGIHGAHDRETASTRYYNLKYRRALEGGAELVFLARAFRDRDGIRNLRRGEHMGARETDNATISLGLKHLALGERTKVSPTVFYQSGISKFKRDNIVKSLDDNAFGFSAIAEHETGSVTLGADLSSDIRYFDSRIHDLSWHRNDTRLSANLSEQDGRFRYSLLGGVLRSSQYGTGWTGSGEAAYDLTQTLFLTAHVKTGDEFPDSGMEVYPSLSYSDSAIVTNPDRYRTDEIEAGVQYQGDSLRMGFYGFITKTGHPWFDPSTYLCRQSGGEQYSGIRTFAERSLKGWYRGRVSISYTDGPDSGAFNPCPVFNADLFSQIRRAFFNGRLDGKAFASARISTWKDVMTPDKTTFFLDTGASITVLTLSAYFKVENITGESMRWFGTYGWTDITTIWGVSWNLIN
ncbi:hypothetical protein ACFL47_10120 [Candidatus Latescibacterota bacterium]